MSADNWAVCPKCVEKYNIPIVTGNPANTFRENWDIGVVGKEFSINYRGVCKECEFRYEFNFSTDVIWKK
jgi:hypothetical protein